MKVQQQGDRKQSHYARKRAKPESMMYGLGCCAHGVKLPYWAG